MKSEDILGRDDNFKETDGPTLDLEYKPFPTNCLPKTLAVFVWEASEALSCDPSYLALPLLTSLASAIGNTRRIVLNRQWSEPPILWSAILGDSGSMKTPALNLALESIREYQKQQFQVYEEAKSAYETVLVKPVSDTIRKASFPRKRESRTPSGRYKKTLFQPLERFLDGPVSPDHDAEGAFSLPNSSSIKIDPMN